MSGVLGRSMTTGSSSSSGVTSGSGVVAHPASAASTMAANAPLRQRVTGPPQA
jgi:hypothetical protein